MAKKTNDDIIIEDTESVSVIVEMIEPTILMLASNFAEQHGYRPEIVQAVKTLNPLYKEYLSANEWKDIFDALMVKPVSVKWDTWLNEYKSRRST